MSALDFPNSPSTNDTFVSNGVTWKYDGVKWDLVSGPSGYVTDTAPSPTYTGDLWYDTNSGELLIRYDSQWVAPLAPATVPTASATTITGLNQEGTGLSFARADHNHAVQGEGWTNVTDWIALSGDNGGWSSYTGVTARFFKDVSGIVYLEGSVKRSQSVSNPSNMFYLPAGYRPAQRLEFLVVSAANAPCRMSVHTDGLVTGVWQHSATWTVLDGIRFRAA